MFIIKPMKYNFCIPQKVLHAFQKHTARDTIPELFLFMFSFIILPNVNLNSFLSVYTYRKLLTNGTHYDLLFIHHW